MPRQTVGKMPKIYALLFEIRAFLSLIAQNVSDRTFYAIF